MIRIYKSTTIPKILIEKGVPATAEMCRLYLANPTDYEIGNLTFVIDSKIYGSQTVKQQLILEQYDKCCFCEAQISHISHGDVEHFRPKAGFMRDKIKVKSNIFIKRFQRPGYYWLAYDWENLFFSCQICNQRFKKNYFPLENETKRAKNHTFDYSEELPLLLHPSTDKPEDHITFNRHVALAKSERGKISISGFGIDRPELNKIREAYLQNIRNNIAYANVDLNTVTDEERQQYCHIMKTSWPVLQDLILKAKEFVAVAASDAQPFAAMVRANFPDLV